MRMQRRRLVSFVVGLTLACAASMGTPLPQDAAAVCAEIDQAAAATEGPATPVVRSGPPIDLNWLVLSSESTVSVDPSSGRPITTTVTVRQDPSGRPHVSATAASQSDLGHALGPQVASAFSCFNGISQSVTIDTGMGIPAVFTEHFKLYYNRYQAGEPGDWAYAYFNWQTDVWWTRTSTAYSLSGQSNRWFHNGWRCDQFQDQRDASGGGWLPSWMDTNNTFTYGYFGPMNTWPTLWAGLCPICGLLFAEQKTDVTEFGSYAGTLTGTYTYPKQ